MIRVFLLAALYAMAVLFASGSQAVAATTGPAPAISPPPMLTTRPVIYVVGEGDTHSPGVVIGVARELNKMVSQGGSDWDNTWIIPMPSSSPAQVAALCPQPSAVKSDDGSNRMIGFIVVSFTYTLTDRFYILVSHDATHLYPFVQVVVCPTYGEDPIEAPTVVAAISQLSTANGTPWVISQSEVSVPLASYAGVAGLLSKKFTTSETNTILAAALSSATNYSIPGFSEGRRLQHATAHLADDVVGELGAYWCPRVRAPAPASRSTVGPSSAGTKMCEILAPTPSPSAMATPSPSP